MKITCEIWIVEVYFLSRPMSVGYQSHLQTDDPRIPWVKAEICMIFYRGGADVKNMRLVFYT